MYRVSDKGYLPTASVCSSPPLAHIPARNRPLTNQLSGEKFQQCGVPPGFTHGFCVLSEQVGVEHRMADFHDPVDEISIIWNDPDLAIRWPIADPVLSKKDGTAHRSRDIMALLRVHAMEWGESAGRGKQFEGVTRTVAKKFRSHHAVSAQSGERDRSVSICSPPRHAFLTVCHHRSTFNRSRRDEAHLLRMLSAIGVIGVGLRSSSSRLL
jgi:hypothetical protein